MATKVAPELLKDVCAEHNLTHVKTEEKNPLPSAEGKLFLLFHLNSHHHLFSVPCNALYIIIYVILFSTFIT